MIAGIALGGGVFHDGKLKSSVHSGAVSRERLDEMVVQILTPFYRLGQDSVIQYCTSFPRHTHSCFIGLSTCQL